MKFVTYILLLGFVAPACGLYSFTDASIPPEVKTIKINTFTNNALLVNPLLNTMATNELRNKIQSQTKLTIVNKGSADYEINGVITTYSVSFSDVGANNVVNKNQLTVTINYSFTNNIEDIVPNIKSQEIPLTAKAEFDASQSLNTVENTLLQNTIVPQITNQAFNKIFSSW